MLLNSPIYPTASQTLRENPWPLPLPHPSLTKSQDFVPKTGRRTQVSSREWHPSGHPASSSWEHLFPSALPLASPTLSLLQLIYLAFMAQHQKLAPRQWQDGKQIRTSTNHSLLHHLLSILDFHHSSLTASSQDQLGQKYIKFQWNGMENSYVSY